MKKEIFIFLIFLLAIFCFLYGFQKQKQLIPPEKYEVEVRLILVDVIVTKDGEFVKDLRKEDFVLFEDGQRVPINSFEFISFEERELKILEEKQEQKPPFLPKKKLAVIFDAINSWQREIKQGSERIIDELVSLVKLGHEVMILQLHRRKGMEILQPFTTEEELIKEAVRKASGSIWKLGTEIGPLREVESVEDRSERVRGRSERESMGEEDAGPETIGHIADMTRIGYLLREKQRFEKTIGGILAAFNMMKSMPGRKSILLISSGIPDLSPEDMLPNMRRGIPGESTHRSKDLFRIEDLRVFDPFNILEKKTFRNGEEVIREMIRFANVQNISIYSLDSDVFVKYIFSGASAEYQQKRDMIHFKLWEKDKIRKVQNLRWISEDTGADLLRGANKFDRFRQVMSTDLNYYYQLSFYPQRKEADDEYHKIKVKVNRRGVDVRFRKGYTDYSKEEANKMQLVTAFYNPNMFKELPFKAEFIPFVAKSGKYEPWMNIALPAKELFIDRFVEYSPKIFNLHVWIKDKNSGEKGFGGQIKMPININSPFMNFIKTVDYLSYHFKGPEVNFGRKEYQTIFALVDPQTKEIGTWESSLSLPDFRKSKKGVLLNCVLGDMTSNPKKGGKSFSLSKRDGSLEYGQFKFFPKVTNQFLRRDAASVFMQIYLPQGKIEIQEEFIITGEDRILHPLPGNLAAESWNKKTKVWSGIFSLDLSTAPHGESSLHVKIPTSEGEAILSKEIKITILH